MREHREAFNNSEAQRRFCALDQKGKLPQHQIQSRLGNRFTSMLNELYGGRTAIRHYLLTGRFENIRLPPLRRLPAGQRQPTPEPRARPNATGRRSKYYDKLATELAEYARTGRAPYPQRSTRLWDEFAPQAGRQYYVSRRYPREAGYLNQALRGWSPDRREDTREDRQGRPSGGSRVSADPGAREADRLNQARGGRCPDRRDDSRERQGRPSEGSRVSADPGLDAGDRRRPGTEGGCH